MPTASPLLRLALAGTSLTVASASAAADLHTSVFAGLRLSVAKGHGFGLGTVVKPGLLVTPEEGWVGAHLGLPFVWTHTFGEHKSNTLDLMGQLGGGASFLPCYTNEVAWYAPVVALSGQAGLRWSEGERHTLVGANLSGGVGFELDYTADLTDTSHRRAALGLGYPVPLTSCSFIVEGRPLRDPEGALASACVEVLGEEVRGGGGSGEPSPEAAEWLKRAADELGAVRAFAELADHLRAHGAPRALVDRAARAAEEELEHAALCMGMAAELLGRPVRGTVPAATGRPLPELAVLAAESHVDGWHNEGLASEAAAERAAVATDPRRRAVEARIAAEETDHAHLGRAIDRWASWSGGRTLRRQRDEVVESLRPSSGALRA